jgi:hypothetical protein
VQRIVDDIAGLTLLEAADLVQALKVRRCSPDHAGCTADCRPARRA